MATRQSPVMTEQVAGGRLSSWYDYLTAPAVNNPTDLPTPDQYVLIALLADGGTARLGTARYYPMSQTYRLAEGSLEIPLSACGPNEVYTTDSGRYRILTPTQHLELKKQESMAAAAAAQVAIAPKVPAPMPTEHMASLSLQPPTPAAVGCGLHSQISTVVAVGPANVEAAAQRVRPLVDLARGNNNVVTLVVLGVVTEADARAALALPTPRIFLAGGNEMVALRDRAQTGPIRKYLEEAVLMAYVMPSAKDTSADPNEVMWLIPASPVPLDGAVGVLPQMRRTLTMWTRDLNTQWKEWYARYNGTSETLDDKEEQLLRAYTSFPIKQRHPPLLGLTPKSMGLIGTIEGPPIGLVDHTIEWTPESKARTSFWPNPASRWATTGTPMRDGSVYWSVATWCHNTKAALRAPHPLLDNQLSFDDLQYDVSIALATLLTHTLQGGAQPYLKALNKLRGVLGPVVLAGRGNNEPMRVTYWTLDDAPPATMLLPEGYVQEVLADYNVASGNRAMLTTRGFLVLPRADEVPIGFAGLSEAELDSERSLFGARLWIQAKPRMPPSIELPQSPVGSMVAYRTQADANAKPNPLLVPGARIAADATSQVYFVATTSEDQLCGLRVCWSNADGRPILDVNTFAGGNQVAYESVL